MSIFNRTLDSSEQRKTIPTVVSVPNGTSHIIPTGVTSIIATIPFNCVLDEAQMVALGVSGSPTVQLTVNRFIAGTGLSTFIVATGTSNIPASYGTSGAGAFGTSLFGTSGMILAASGSTLLNLLANDVIVLSFGGANSAVNDLCINLVVRPIQDTKTFFGLF